MNEALKAYRDIGIYLFLYFATIMFLFFGFCLMIETKAGVPLILFGVLGIFFLLYPDDLFKEEVK